MKTTKFLMDMYSDDFYTAMVDYVYDDSGLDLPLGTALFLMGQEI